MNKHWDFKKNRLPLWILRIMAISFLAIAIFFIISPYKLKIVPNEACAQCVPIFLNQSGCYRITYSAAGNVMCAPGFYAAGIWDDGGGPPGPNGLVCCQSM